MGMAGGRAPGRLDVGIRTGRHLRSASRHGQGPDGSGVAWRGGDSHGLSHHRPQDDRLQGNVMLRSHGNMNYNSLQAKLERRFQDGLALSMGYTWSKAMALNYNGTWGDWRGSRDYERHAMKAPMRHDRAHTFYNSTIWQLPFFGHAQDLTRTLLGGNHYRHVDHGGHLPDLVRSRPVEPGHAQQAVPGPDRGHGFAWHRRDDRPFLLPKREVGGLWLQVQGWQSAEEGEPRGWEAPGDLRPEGPASCRGHLGPGRDHRPRDHGPSVPGLRPGRRSPEHHYSQPGEARAPPLLAPVSAGGQECRLRHPERAAV